MMEFSFLFTLIFTFINSMFRIHLIRRLQIEFVAARLLAGAY